jgi:hypothetical protein
MRREEKQPRARVKRWQGHDTKAAAEIP